MIINESEYSDSKSPTVRSGDSEVPDSPPPYVPSLSPQTQPVSDSKPLPTPLLSDDWTSQCDADPVPPPNLPPRCNHLVENKQNNSVKGVWHVDTSLSIPDSLLAPLEEFDGAWNESEQKAQKKDKGKRRSSDSVLTRTNPNVRPNLMLKSKHGSIAGEVHVVTGDGIARPGLIVAEGYNGSVTLDVRTYATQPLRIFAVSRNGSVRVKIPESFEGAVIVSSHNGNTNISDPVKTRLTTFSGSSGSTRGFIGDWQAARFGSTPTPPASAALSFDPSADPPLPTIPDDPFTTWTGPLVHVSSHNGSVHLSFVDEGRAGGDREAGIPSTFKGFMSGLFGNGEESGRGGRGWGCGRRGGPWESFRPGVGPFGAGAGPFGHDGGAFGAGGGPFDRGAGPFGHHGGPFGRGGPFDGPFGCSGSRGSFGRRGGCSSWSSWKRGAWSDKKAPGHEGEENENWYPPHKQGSSF